MNRLHYILVSSFGMSICAAQGCTYSGGNSSSYATSSIAAAFSVAAHDDKTLLFEAALEGVNDDSTSVAIELHGSESLVASLDEPLSNGGDIGGGQFNEVSGLAKTHKRMKLKLDDTGTARNEYHYESMFSDVAPGRTVFIEFYRDEKQDAIGSYVVIPPGFEITLPSAQQQFSASADDITISWSPADPSAATTITASQSCADVGTGSWTSTQLLDVGNATIPAGAFTSTGQCTVMIVVDRFTSGVVDGNFHHGQFLAHQTRRVSATLVP